MADLGDMASELEGEHLARALAGVRAVEIAAGVAGDCAECGEESARLVGGRCAPCRDGDARRVMLSGDAAPAAPGRAWVLPPAREARAAAVPVKAAGGQEVAVSVLERSQAVAATGAQGERTRQINVRIGGAPLAAIEAGVEVHGTLGASALALIKAGIAGAGDAMAEAPPAIGLEAVHLDALLAEVARRFAQAGAAELAEATARPSWRRRRRGRRRRKRRWARRRRGGRGCARRWREPHLLHR